uniref:Uncharacterized protein n=1 Tax=Arundo donax TaxID=35708 RepID=A0A0A8Y235_ARUDO
MLLPRRQARLQPSIQNPKQGIIQLCRVPFCKAWHHVR